MCLLEALGSTFGANEVSADLLGIPDEEFFIVWLGYANHNPSTRDQKVLAMCLLEALGALTGANEVSADLLGLPDEEVLLVGMWHPQPQHQLPKGVGHVPPGGPG